MSSLAQGLWVFCIFSSSRRWGTQWKWSCERWESGRFLDLNIWITLCMRAGLCVLQGQTHWEDASPAPRALSQGPAGRRREERRGEKSREERRREEKPSRQRSGENPHPPPCAGHPLGGGLSSICCWASVPSSPLRCPGRRSFWRRRNAWEAFLASMLFIAHTLLCCKGTF